VIPHRWEFSIQVVLEQSLFENTRNLQCGFVRHTEIKNFVFLSRKEMEINLFCIFGLLCNFQSGTFIYFSHRNRADMSLFINVIKTEQTLTIIFSRRTHTFAIPAAPSVMIGWLCYDRLVGWVVVCRLMMVKSRLTNSVASRSHDPHSKLLLSRRSPLIRIVSATPFGTVSKMLQNGQD